jgi:hypothetical protein
VLGEYIGWITLTVDLAKVYAVGPHGLLDPKRVCVEVSKFAQPLPGAYPYCSAGVSPDAQGQFDADVLE